MSNGYQEVHSSGIQAIGVVYLIFLIGCLLFFLGGICALLCCCNQRFRGIERKGYVVRDANAMNAPLMVPSIQGPLQPMPYPGGPQPGPGWVVPSYPSDPPPKY